MREFKINKVQGLDDGTEKAILLAGSEKAVLAVVIKKKGEGSNEKENASKDENPFQ